jgi:hypothetical protein
MRRRRWLAAVALATGPFAARVGAQEEGRVPFVARLAVGARALALGGATAAIRDADGLFGNPALAGTVTSAAVTVARYRHAASAGLLSSSYVVGPMGLAIGVHYLDHSERPFPEDGLAPSSDGLLTRGPRPAASLLASVATAVAYKGVRWGLAAKYLEERGSTDRASVVAADLGATKDFTYVTLGLTVQNLGPDMVTSYGDRGLATRVALSAYGIGLPVGPYVDFAMSGGASLLADGFLAASLGGELSWVPIEGVALALRQGIRRAELRAQDPWTGGLGFALDRLAVDYAFERLQRRLAHRVTVKVR